MIGPAQMGALLIVQCQESVKIAQNPVEEQQLVAVGVTATLLQQSLVVHFAQVFYRQDIV